MYSHNVVFAQHIQHDLSDGAEEHFGKGDRIRGQVNHQQVQIYCMDQSQKISARIIVVGQDKNKVKHTFNQISQAYSSNNDLDLLDGFGDLKRSCYIFKSSADIFQLLFI